jgi:hypothetical protein
MRPAHNKIWQDNRADRIAPLPSKVLDVWRSLGSPSGKRGSVAGLSGDEPATRPSAVGWRQGKATQPFAVAAPRSGLFRAGD